MLNIFKINYKQLNFANIIVETTTVQDYSKLKQVGPLVKILNEILFVGEQFKKPD